MSVSAHDGWPRIGSNQINRNIHVETRLLSSPRALGIVKREVGCERLVFGSGAPLYYPASAIGIVMHGDLSDEDKQRVFAGNILRLLGRDRP